MKVKTDKFVEGARKELKNTHTRGLLSVMTTVISAIRQNAMSTFSDPEAATEFSRAIRAEAVARLPELLEEFEKNATAHGAKVFWAADAGEANEFILKIAKERGIKYVTKGKSMVTEETGLNEVLTENGIEVFEADLGEFIAQQLERPPFHIVGPAINIPVEEICDIFMEKAEMKEPTHDPVELGAAARRFLRDKFHHLGMGITGVNVAVAETGTIINVENEGNIRFCKSSPKTQVSVMTLEKVVPTMNDAVHIVRMLCRNCTGQKISSYVSMDTGPRLEGEIDGPEELFIVIVDNGRSDFYGDPQSREALRCIRCGGCMYNCPVYTKIGGYPYGWAYSGPMGQVLNPLLLGLDKTQDLYRACTLCGECKAICPAGIDHPSMFLSYRARDVERDIEHGARPRPVTESAFTALFTWAAKKAARWNLGTKSVRPLFNSGAEDGMVKRFFGALKGWFSIRDLPIISEETFRERMMDRDEDENDKDATGELPPDENGRP
jgi:L-lactate dehydrogenase complex protein LldF